MKLFSLLYKEYTCSYVLEFYTIAVWETLSENCACVPANDTALFQLWGKHLLAVAAQERTIQLAGGREKREDTTL